jgi:hypothetical protein
MNSCQYIRSITITIVPPLDLSLLDFISALRETQLRHQHQTESAHPKRHSPSRSPAHEQSRFTTNNAAEIDEPNHYHPIDDAHVETKRVGACRRVAAPPGPSSSERGRNRWPGHQTWDEAKAWWSCGWIVCGEAFVPPGKDPVIAERSFFGVA